jgi:S1-C subfamily serine protease
VRRTAGYSAALKELLCLSKGDWTSLLAVSIELMLEAKAVSRNKPLVFLLILGILILGTFQSEVAGRQGSTPVAIPSLQTLKLLDYSKAENGKQNDAVGYAELEELINACQTYSKGLDVLPRFHEPILTRGESGIAVFRRVSPSVVMVLTANFKDDKVTESGLGTGVIIDPAGYILTNWHVVHGFETGIVFLKPAVGTEPDKNSGYGLRLIAESEQADLALLKIVKPPAGLVPVKLGDISAVQVAEDIHVIGHPHGQLWSYSSGVVSQVRDNYDWEYSDGSKHLAKVLQLQTAINPGNSGGPVLDNNASMLGLIAMSEEGQNLDYAVAIDVIKDFVNKSLAARSRGTEARSPTEKGVRYVASTKEGLSVSKIVYSNLVSYTIRDSKSIAIGLIVETSDGGVLTGSNLNAFGGFSEWIYKPASGKTVSVKSSGTAPDLVSLATKD